MAGPQVFGPVYVITQGGPAGSTIVPAYYAYLEFFTKRNVGYGATIATVLTILVVIVRQRHPKSSHYCITDKLIYCTIELCN